MRQALVLKCILFQRFWSMSTLLYFHVNFKVIISIQLIALK